MNKTKVLQFSTHNEDCGIAKYQEQFVAEIIHEPDFETDFFEYSPNYIKKLGEKELSKVLKDLERKLLPYNVLHIQHEYSFFNGRELQKVINLAKKLKKKVIVTVHTAPDAQYKHPVLPGIGPTSLRIYARQKVSAKRFRTKYVEPLKKVDLIIVHNNVTKESLIRFGVTADRIRVIRIPVPEASRGSSSNEIKKALNVQPGDTIFSTVGFISEAKGILDAVKALKYLPESYKLAIIGGIHPQGGNEKFLDKVTDLVNELGYKERVYITGFVESDENLNSLIRECDICIYPFDRKYYSYVSSASLNNAIANHKPIIAYRTRPFEEVNQEIPLIEFAKSSNYYELARAIKGINIDEASKLSKQYADKHSYSKEAKQFYNIYREVNAS